LPCQIYYRQARRKNTATGGAIRVAQAGYPAIEPRTKAKLKAASAGYMQALESVPERVKKYSQDLRVKYVA
jgi:hypothetical protein